MHRSCVWSILTCMLLLVVPKVFTRIDIFCRFGNIASNLCFTYISKFQYFDQICIYSFNSIRLAVASTILQYGIYHYTIQSEVYWIHLFYICIVLQRCNQSFGTTAEAVLYAYPNPAGNYFAVDLIYLHTNASHYQHLAIAIHNLNFTYKYLCCSWTKI